MTGFRTFTRSLALMMGMLGSAAWGQTGVMSVRLGGYLPNSYGQCRPISGFGNGTGRSCTLSTDCFAGETCGKMFRDISCSTDLDCQLATGGLSRCVETAVFPTDPPITAMRCSAVDVAPEGMIGPADTLFLEVFLDEWDQTPDLGVCENGINACSVDDPAPCKSCRQINGPPGWPCVDTGDCAPPDTCRQDTHCETPAGAHTGILCDNNSAQCGIGRVCVPDECLVHPTIITFQWTIDSSGFSNDHGPGSVLIPGDIPCMSATQLDDCRHGYPTGCALCSVAVCDRIDAGGNGECSPGANAFVYTARLDFIFALRNPTSACTTATANYSCGSVTLRPGAVDDGTPRYLGTAVVMVSDYACGTFRVDLIRNPLYTFLNNRFGVRLPEVVSNELVLNVSPEPVCTPVCEDDGNLCTDDLCHCAGFCIHPPAVECRRPASCNPSTGLCEACGNGTIEGAEECDDEGESATCDADCTIAECGDDTLNMTAGETCDGDDNELCAGWRCKTDCTCSLPRPETPVPVAD